MNELTADDVGRIVQAEILASGNANTATLMRAWAAMVATILERLDLREHQATSLRLAVPVVGIWGRVMPRAQYPREHEFEFHGDETQWLRDLYLDVWAKRAMVRAFLPMLPPRTPEEVQRDLRELDDIRTFCDKALEDVDVFEAKAGGGLVLSVKAFGFASVASCCMSLLAIILGPDASDVFRRQYDRGARVLDEFVRLSNAGRTGKGN